MVLIFNLIEFNAHQKKMSKAKKDIWNLMMFIIEI